MPSHPSSSLAHSPLVARQLAQLAAARQQVRHLSLAIARDLGLDLPGVTPLLPTAQPAAMTMEPSSAGSSMEPRRAKKHRLKRRWQSIPDSIARKAIAQLAAGDSQPKVAREHGISLSSVYNLSRKARLEAKAVRAGRRASAKKPAKHSGQLRKPKAARQMRKSSPVIAPQTEAA